MDSNTITTKNKENSEIPYKEIYQWSSELTAEQEAKPGYYLWTDEDRKLLFRLMNTKGNLIAVIGLQGSGKTALKEALSSELSKKKCKHLSLKWINGRAQLEKETYSSLRGDLELIIMLVEKLIRIQGKAKALKILEKEFGKKIAEDLFWLYKNELDLEKGTRQYFRNKLAPIFPKLMTLTKYFGKEKDIFEKENLLDFLFSASCILIDTPDYDKRNRREMIRDLNALQALWEELNEYSYEMGDYPPNMVVFFQKELFQGHFFFGKMLVHEKKPLNPRQMTDYFEKRFPDHPFTREALEELAALSRGIFRRFKKYIQTCLENYYLSQDISKITVEHVKKWISMDMLIRDMELELLDIFPKRKEQRVMTVKLLRYLHERGGMTSQKEITEDLFEGEKMACSRLLRTLESHGYIIRVKKRGEKGYLVYLPDKYQEGGDIKV
ncbi:MAG: hypothetical protein J7K49_00820 [Thaumarchaeota archaeon]|nr:hypothetical protein [Nitrososphaerota archaeon]